MYGSKNTAAAFLAMFLVVAFSFQPLNSSLYGAIIPGLSDSDLRVSNFPSTTLSTGTSNIISAQSSALPFTTDRSNIISAQSGAQVCDVITTLGCVTVTKQLLDPDNLVDDSVEQDLEFLIQITDGAGIVRSSLLYGAGESNTLTLNDGDAFNVQEVGDPIPNVVTVSTTLQGQCSGTVEAGTNNVCFVINTITEAEEDVTVVEPEIEPESSPAGVQSEEVLTIGAQAGTTPTSGSGATLGLRNPPFDLCEGNSKTVSGADIRGVDENALKALVRAPNAATYTAGGTIPLNEVRQAMDEFNTEIMSIQIYSNLEDPQSQANLPLAISNPQFRGAVVVADKEGVNHEVVNFNLNTIRTECKFITVAQPDEDAPLKNVYSLGVLGKDKSVEPSPINQMLIQERENLVVQIQNGLPPVLNSPFAVCQDTKTGAQKSQNDDIAIYSLSGKVSDRGELYGNNLNVELTVDLNLNSGDLAKITDNNNPYMRVNLVANEDKDSAHKIPFTLQHLWTDCKNVALNFKPLFEPIQSEIPP
jgi:hypothetical protein